MNVNWIKGLKAAVLAFVAATAEAYLGPVEMLINIISQFFAS